MEQNTNINNSGTQKPHIQCRYSLLDLPVSGSVAHRLSGENARETLEQRPVSSGCPRNAASYCATVAGVVATDHPACPESTSYTSQFKKVQHIEKNRNYS